MKIVILLFLPVAVLCYGNYNPENFIVPKKPKAHKHMTSTGAPDYTTREMFVFEGVDYDMLPEGYIKEKNNDCNALHFRCIENTILMNHVCGWNYHTY